MFKPDILMADMIHCKENQRTNQKHQNWSNFTKQPRLETAKEGIVLIKNMQINKMNIIGHTD